MKYLLTGLTLLSILLSNFAYAEKETKINSFGDKNFKYKSLYKKKNKKSLDKIKIGSATKRDDNQSQKSRKRNGSQEKSKYRRYLSH